MSFVGKWFCEECLGRIKVERASPVRERAFPIRERGGRCKETPASRKVAPRSELSSDSSATVSSDGISIARVFSLCLAARSPTH